MQDATDRENADSAMDCSTDSTQTFDTSAKVISSDMDTYDKSTVQSDTSKVTLGIPESEDIIRVNVR